MNVKSFFLSTCVVLWMGSAYAQQQKSALVLAEEHYDRYEYKRATVLYESAAQRKELKTAALRKLADCYRHINAYQASAKLYEKITALPDTEVSDLLYYADALKCQGNYDEAKKVYARYMQQGGQDVTNRIAGCDSAVVWKSRPVDFIIQNREDLNTGSSEWGAVWYQNKQLIFTSDSLRYTMLSAKQREFKRTGNAYQKLYRVDTIHNDPDAILIRGFDAVLNDYKYHIGPVVFSAEGDTAYLTVTDPDRIAYKRSYGTRRLELYVSVKKGGTWQQPVPFQHNKPELYSMGHAALSRDGRLLYFTSDMPGSVGKTDIWYCEKQENGTWGTPVNCGVVINTIEEEGFPTVNEEGELSFSSKGHAGMGGFDIFYAKGKAGNWSAPVNLGNLFNSEADDFYLIRNTPASGLFASNRNGGRGDDDIYAFTSGKITTATTPVRDVIVLEASVYGKESKTPLGQSLVTLVDENRNANWTQVTDEKGKTYIILAKGHQYTVFASKERYAFTASQRFSADRLDTIRMDLFLAPAVPSVGSVFVLTNIYYDRDEYKIRREGYASLDSLVALMERYPGLHIELASHTDSRATEAYNIILSEKRAAVVMDYLVKQGIASERIVAKGYGESRLVNACKSWVDCTEEEHQANRRTEVRVLKR